LGVKAAYSSAGQCQRSDRAEREASQVIIAIQCADMLDDSLVLMAHGRICRQFHFSYSHVLF
jgi:hypothetical protein